MGGFGNKTRNDHPGSQDISKEKEQPEEMDRGPKRRKENKKHFHAFMSYII